MDDINKVMLMGRVVRAPKVYQLENGEMYAIASMITREREENEQGETQEYTDYHALVFPPRLVEIAKNSLIEGSLILIKGRLRTDQWKDGNGTTHHTPHIQVDTFKYQGYEEVAPNKEEAQS